METKKTKKMKTNTTTKTKKTKWHNYFYYYYGRQITRAEFIKAVPSSWQDEVDEYGTYSWRGYRAIDIDEYAEKTIKNN